MIEIGMFDYVKVDYPLPEGHNYIPDWQTKDFDRMLWTYLITVEGRLFCKKFDYEVVPEEERPYKDEPGLLGLAGSLRQVNERTEPVSHYGIVHFYTMRNGEWIEYAAKFMGGKLLDVRRVPGVDWTGLTGGGLS